MPYFVRIGRVTSNKSGVGSRGWYARRLRNRVLVKWGSVEVVPGGSALRMYWGRGWPQEREYRFRSVNLAKEFMGARACERLGSGTHGGYERLPPRQKIRTRPAGW